MNQTMNIHIRPAAALTAALRLLCLLCLAVSLTAVGTQPAQAQQHNTVVLSTADSGEQQLNTSEVQSIRFDGGRVIVTQPWGETVFDRTLRSLTFLRPLPGTLRLTVSSTIGSEDSMRRALSIGGDGKLKSTWEDGDRVYVYSDAVSTTPIGTLTPQTTGEATAVLVGDIEAEGLADNQTLYLSTVARPHSFATQSGILSSLFYATAESVLTINGGNAVMGDAAFSNSQSVTAFTMKDGNGADVAIKSLTISGGAEDISVTLDEAAATVYVAMPATDVQTTYTFAATTSDDKVRTGVKKANVQNGQYYRASVTVKLASSITAAPAATDVHYTGEAQQIVTAATADGGIVWYKVGDGDYSTSLPEATDIGTYTVYYKVVGDADHHDAAEQYMEASVGRGIGSISYAETTVAKGYSDDAFTNPLTKVGDGTVTYASGNESVATVDENSGEVTIMNAGSAVITATVSNGANYDYAVTTAQYTVTIGKSSGSINYATKTLNKTYGDAAFTNTLTKVGDGTVTYASGNTSVATVDENSGEVTITGVGTAVITATVADGTNYTYATNTATYTISVGKGAPTYTAPAFSALTYTGSAQNLVSAGSSEHGTFTYSTSENGEYTTTVPQGTNAGNYTVWYKFTGDANHTDIGATEVTGVTIAKASISPSVSMSGWTYGGTASSPSVSGNTGGGSVTYQYKVSTAADGTYTTTKPSSAGTYTVKATIAETTNYNSGSATANFTIAKASGAATLSATSVAFGTTTGSKTVTVSSNTGTVSASVTSGSGCSVSVSGTTITITRSSNAAFSATITVTIAAATNYNSTTKTVSVSGTDVYSAGSVESATMGSYKCAKVYTSASSGYYIMCNDQSTSCTWPTACGYSVSAGGKTFTCGTKAQWEAIMSACGGTGTNSINTKCSGVTGWSTMDARYWSSTEKDSGSVWCFYSSGWVGSAKDWNYTVRLVSAF